MQHTIVVWPSLHCLLEIPPRLRFVATSGSSVPQKELAFDAEILVISQASTEFADLVELSLGQQILSKAAPAMPIPGHLADNLPPLLFCFWQLAHVSKRNGEVVPRQMTLQPMYHAAEVPVIADSKDGMIGLHCVSKLSLVVQQTCL